MINWKKLFLYNLPFIKESEYKSLEKKNITCVESLLYLQPKEYEDRINFNTIENAYVLEQKKALQNPNDTLKNVMLIALCSKKNSLFIKKKIPQFIFSDDTSSITFTAFNPTQRYFKVGNYYILSGKIEKKYQKYQIIINDSFLIGKDINGVKNINTPHFGRIVPIYSSIGMLKPKRIREIIWQLLEYVNSQGIEYELPTPIIKKYQFFDKIKILQELHFPSKFNAAEIARRVLSYEDFFNLQWKLLLKKYDNRIKRGSHKYPKTEKLNLFIQSLPFKLTQEQTKVLQEIKQDIQSMYLMERILQGEVGCGKTIISACCMILSAENNKQTVLMVPTDVLARQHWEKLQPFFQSLGIQSALLTGSKTEKEKANIIKLIRTGYISIVIGTHAVFQKNVDFFNLGLVVIDEQQRFGVEDRRNLLKKGNLTDFLMMSATPIPRSLSMTIFGHQDISVISKTPHKNIDRKTKILHDKDRIESYQFLLNRIKLGEQAYIVFPLIEPILSEKEEITTSDFLYKDLNKNKLLKRKNLLEQYKYLTQGILKNISCGVIHGKMKEKEKIETMQKFESGSINVLFATSILEVGIDIANATIIIIEGAEFFGLSQLHQLRGRVGRAKKRGYCFLIVDSEANSDSFNRVNQFAKIHNGFEIAELDLKLRGPGEMLGRKQTGGLETKIANFQKILTF